MIERRGERISLTPGRGVSDVSMRSAPCLGVGLIEVSGGGTGSAPCSTATLQPSAEMNFLTVSGVAATRVSPGVALHRYQTDLGKVEHNHRPKSRLRGRLLAIRNLPEERLLQFCRSWLRESAPSVLQQHGSQLQSSVRTASATATTVAMPLNVGNHAVHCWPVARQRLV